MKKDKIKILIAGAECTPFAKTGGLADVIGTLPKALDALGLDAVSYTHLRIFYRLTGIFSDYLL